MGFLSWPYIEGVSAWGEMTSANIFCELDFYMTSYVAELINTLTSSMYLYLGWRGVENTKRIKGDKTIMLCYAMLACIGPGSMAYHMTIKYTGQMIDEFSMLYATGTIAYAALSVSLGPETRRLLGMLVAVISVGVSLVHYCLNHTVGFQTVFGTMVGAIFCQCVWLVSTKVKDPKAVNNMKRLALYGAVCWVGGYALWNIDNQACSELRNFRDIVGMPLGFVSELHGWWHIFTGLGVYYYIVFIEYLRLYVEPQKKRSTESPHVVLVWCSAFSLPHIETKKNRVSMDPQKAQPVTR